MTAASRDSVIDFCKTVLAVNYEQRLAVLRHISSSQCSIVRQIAYNVLLNEDVSLSDKERTYLRRHLNSVKELASRKVCAERKRLVLVKKHLLVKRLCSIALRYLT